MQPNEFTAWLEGFLDGKDSLNAEQIATLRAKADKLTPLKGLQFPPNVRDPGVAGVAPIRGIAVASDPHTYAGKAL